MLVKSLRVKIKRNLSSLRKTPLSIVKRGMKIVGVGRYYGVNVLTNLLIKAYGYKIKACTKTSDPSSAKISLYDSV
jgi:hypothetical protein